MPRLLIRFKFHAFYGLNSTLELSRKSNLMKKIFFFISFFILNLLNAQFSNETEFIDFGNQSIARQKAVLLKLKWKQVSTKKASQGGEVSIFTKTLGGNRKFSLILRRINAPNSVIRDTELIFPAEDYDILSKWIINLSKLGYNFYQEDSYTVVASGRGYRLIITMYSGEDGVENKINFIRTEK